MALLTVIGQGVRVRGRITGDADLTIEGHVEGEVAVSGEVTVETGGLLGANVTARVIVVRGAVRGDLTAEEAIRLEDGARVVGDLHAPRISIAKGGLVRGLVQTGGLETTEPRAKTQAAAASRPAARPAAAPARKPAASSPAPAPAPAPAPVQHAPAHSHPNASRPAPHTHAASVSRAAAHTDRTNLHPSVLAGGRAPQAQAAAAPAPAAPPAPAVSKGPPPPVVPALKKGAKAALKKKAQ